MQNNSPFSFSAGPDLSLSPETQAKLRQANANLNVLQAQQQQATANAMKRRCGACGALMKKEHEPCERCSQWKEKKAAHKAPATPKREVGNKKPPKPEQGEDQSRQKVLLAVLCAVLLPSLFMLL